MSLQQENTEHNGNAGRRDFAIGLICVIGSAVCFALAGILIKLVSWNALSIGGARSLFAAVIMYIYLRWQGKRMVFNRATLVAALINLVMFTSFVVANKLTTAANVIVLQFTQPLWVMLLAWVIFKNKPRPQASIACVVIFAGIVCFFADQLSPSGLAGSLLAVFSGATYAAVFLFKKIPGCDFESASVISFVAAFVIGLPFMAGETAWDPQTLLLLAVLGVVQMGLAYVLLARGLDSVSPITASLTSTIEPVLNPILASLVLGETLGPLSLVGAVMVIGAATVYNVWNARQES